MGSYQIRKFAKSACAGNAGNVSLLLWTPKLTYRIPAAVLQILPLVANLWGCRWDKFILFIFLFSFVVYIICFVWVLMPACLSLLSIVWNKCVRHAGSGQCFRPALFWRHHTRLVGVQYFWVVTACGRSYLSLGCVGYTCHWFQWKPPVGDPGMHHGTCVTHVPWYMSGSLTRGGGENVPGIPGACTTRNFIYLVRGP